MDSYQSYEGKPTHFHGKSWGGVGFVAYSGEEDFQFFPENSGTAVTVGERVPESTEEEEPYSRSLAPNPQMITMGLSSGTEI